MKLKLFICAAAAALMLGSTAVMADTVVTAPIDSRPISCEYLGDLARLSGDKVVYPHKECMDLFSNDEGLNHFADSQRVRESIYTLVGENNRENTTVIINTSTYFTGGLVGSRVGSNYESISEGMADLRSLTTDYSKPYYYVNLTTPRSLPETRFNSIWRSTDEINGIAYYYLQRNPNCEDYDYIKAHYARITPTQLLMEYSYVSGKQQEGVPLRDWERDFYRMVNSRYMSKDPYKTYLNSYIRPFEKSVEIMSGLMELKAEGLIDELVISTDDLQLPSSISYFYAQGADWVQKSGGSAVKYSFARTYFSEGSTNIMKLIDAAEGKTERYLCMNGRGKDINVIYGTDEVPQLIYARDLARRKGVKANITPIYNSTSKAVADYDVSNVQRLTSAAVDFVGGYRSAAEGRTDLYIYSYAAGTRAADTIARMKDSKAKGRNVALIELYDSKTLNSSNNELFKRLVEGKSFKISELSAYSAWNTNGNAIGLGVAQAQVYALNSLYTNSAETFASAHTSLLLRHVLEDGVYTVETKRLLSNAGYRPTPEEREDSPKLREYLVREDILSAFRGSTVTVKDKTYRVEEVTVDKCGFPWGRTFDCVLEIGCKVILD